jgi:NAD(P)-dependent dehydrogenase (short-subunit alcohol dehydrogenase family)
MAENSGLMRGKTGLVFGVANNRSIAWGIGKACALAGANVGFTYQGDALKKRVEPLAAEIGGKVVGHCDVTDPATIDAVFEEADRALGPDATSTRRPIISPRPCSSPVTPSLRSRSGRRSGCRKAARS